jgi:hypothetical protein
VDVINGSPLKLDRSSQCGSKSSVARAPKFGIGPEIPECTVLPFRAAPSSVTHRINAEGVEHTSIILQSFHCMRSAFFLSSRLRHLKHSGFASLIDYRISLTLPYIAYMPQRRLLQVACVYLVAHERKLPRSPSLMHARGPSSNSIHWLYTCTSDAHT